MTVINKPRKSLPKDAQTRKQRLGIKTGAAAAAGIVAPATLETMGRDLLVPLSQLFVSESNVRTVHREEGLIELAALIEAQGLLQRLSVVAHSDGRFAVVAGGRRLRAMQMLVASGRWSAEQPVECKRYDETLALQVSLAENSGREDMHPADQMEAFRRLIDQGLTVAQVAGRFGVSPLTVERRLKLARLAPRFLDLYRAEEIEPDQLMALALIEDHSAQEAVWDGLSAYDRSGWRIRSVITAEACSANSRLARYVGLDQYEAEGGAVRRDLFSSPEDLTGIFLENPELLHTLALERLRGEAAVIKEEGWLWVECSLDTDRTALRGYGRLEMDQREPTDEEAQAIDMLVAEQRACADACELHQDEGNPDAEDYDEVEHRLCEALDKVEERLMTARAGLARWSQGQFQISGAFVRIDAQGEVVIERGLVRPEDRKAISELNADDEGQPRDDMSGMKKIKPEFSEKLMRDLTAHRTAAIQAALMRNPHIALVTLVHRMAETVFGLYGAGNDVVKVTVRKLGDGAIAQDASDYASSPAAILLGAAETEWGDRLPGSPAALFSWLLTQSQGTLLELLAYCTARSIDAVSSRPTGRNHSDALVEALGLDMADWWLPTAKSFFSRVSRKQALDALHEATGIDPTHATQKMKKHEAVSYCAHLIQDVRWVPSPLRRATEPAAPNAANEVRREGMPE